VGAGGEPLFVRQRTLPKMFLDCGNHKSIRSGGKNRQNVPDNAYCEIFGD
jgi:hypothetical protein